jgi:hypothetical protein
MALEAEDRGDDAHRDDAATERPADAPAGTPSEHDGSEESGGPYGNPTVDEESLRKQQEESRERSD